MILPFGLNDSAVTGFSTGVTALGLHGILPQPSLILGDSWVKSQVSALSTSGCAPQINKGHFTAYPREDFPFGFYLIYLMDSVDAFSLFLKCWESY